MLGLHILVPDTFFGLCRCRQYHCWAFAGDHTPVDFYAARDFSGGSAGRI